MKKAKLFTHDFSVMGCPCQFKVYCESAYSFKKLKKQVLSELNRLDQTYTTYTNDSLTSKINRLAGSNESLELGEEATALMNYSQACYEQSDGLFDITAGTLHKAWDYHAKPQKLPEKKTVDELLKAVGWGKIEWRPPYIKLPVNNMSIDFGGVVKEYAADVVANICHKNGFMHGFINLGGDIRIIGNHANGKPWRIGIADPSNPKRDLIVLDLACGAVASSGNYERCIVVDGKTYSHILNPKTGQPADGFSSVSILGDFCLVAGSASTIASLMNPDEAIEWLEDLGLPYLCVDRDGKIFKNF